MNDGEEALAEARRSAQLARVALIVSAMAFALGTGAGLAGLLVAPRLRGPKARAVLALLTMGGIRAVHAFHRESHDIARHRVLADDYRIADQRAVRLIGVSASTFSPQASGQLPLLDPAAVRREQLARAIDRITGRFGRSAILPARLLGKDDPSE